MQLLTKNTEVVMKNVKFVLVAAIVSLAMLSYAADIPDRPSRLVKISLSQAQTIPGLVIAMHDQLDNNFLKVEKPTYYAVVKYAGKAWLIYGTHKAWTRFFMLKVRAEKHSIQGSH